MRQIPTKSLTLQPSNSGFRSSKLGQIKSQQQLLRISSKPIVSFPQKPQTSQTFRPKSFLNSSLAEQIIKADFVLIGAGAGFSVDSGLKTFRDIAKIPFYQQQGLTYDDLCDPLWLKRNYLIFYGFWGTCYNAYQTHKPHAGYQNLISFLQSNSKDFFIYTSNIDGFFTNFVDTEQLYEFHGQLRYWQCSGPCSQILYQLKNYTFQVNEKMQCSNTNDKSCKYTRIRPNLLELEGTCLPRCCFCEQLLRPHVLMFEDFSYCDDTNKEDQWKILKKQLKTQNLLILELGCGLKVPSLRIEFERILRTNTQKSVLLRINPSEVGLQQLTKGKDCSRRVFHIKQGGQEYFRQLQVNENDSIHLDAAVEQVLDDFE
eukprot:EST42807.1 Sir2 family protein [Spironucleus salmonicida]